MRRSSTTVSGPATVLPRRYGAKLLQNSSDNTRPRAPATIKMTPTVLMLNPEVVTSTAKVKMAPLGSIGRCNADDGVVSTGRWADGAAGTAGVEPRAEAGAVVALEGRGVAQRDRPGAGQAAGLDPRRCRLQRRVRAGRAPALSARAHDHRTGGDLPRPGRGRLASQDRRAAPPGAVEHQP